MKHLLLPVFLSFFFIPKAQNKIEWTDNYQLRLSDFQSPATQVGQTTIYSLHPGSGMDFSFYMSKAEFMFTKNFNSKVNCSFNRSAASIIAPDSAIATDLLNFGRYDFDLSELYARKFRKKLYEEKGAFSDISFFKPIYDQVQSEFAERHVIAAKTSDLGRNNEKLRELHGDVLKEIEQFSDFCKECKPVKKKK
ncbi:MAG: hypothetical protein V4635_05320 [Bacteroidota bacterium]